MADALRKQLQLDDPNSPGNAMQTLARLYAQWRGQQFPFVDADPMNPPLSAGSMVSPSSGLTNKVLEGSGKTAKNRFEEVVTEMGRRMNGLLRDARLGNQGPLKEADPNIVRAMKAKQNLPTGYIDEYHKPTNKYPARETEPITSPGALYSQWSPPDTYGDIPGIIQNQYRRVHRIPQENVDLSNPHGYPAGYTRSDRLRERSGTARQSVYDALYEAGHKPVFPDIGSEMPTINGRNIIDMNTDAWVPRPTIERHSRATPLRPDQIPQPPPLGFDVNELF